MNDQVIRRGPETIDELRQICSYNGMPLERMRFFIDTDSKEPYAFGIYRDGSRFVVYRNKYDGSQAIRYRGPDEKYAINVLFEKLIQECNSQNMFPDTEMIFGSSLKPEEFYETREELGKSEQLPDTATKSDVTATTALSQEDVMSAPDIFEEPFFVDNEPPEDEDGYNSIVRLKIHLRFSTRHMKNAKDLYRIDDNWNGEFCDPTDNGLALLKRRSDKMYCVFAYGEMIYLGNNEFRAVRWFQAKMGLLIPDRALRAFNTPWERTPYGMNGPMPSEYMRGNTSYGSNGSNESVSVKTVLVLLFIIIIIFILWLSQMVKK